MRERVGDDFVVGIRVVANEFHPQGMDAAALRDAIAMLRGSTRLDFLDLAAGGYHNVHYVFPSAAMPYAWLRDEVSAVKAANADIPVFGVGAALSPEQAEEVIRDGVADMVALTRAQIADPDLAVKLREGRADGIRHCIRLNQGCLGRGSRGLAMSCTVNPQVGLERERAERPAASTAAAVGRGGRRTGRDARGCRARDRRTRGDPVRAGARARRPAAARPRGSGSRQHRPAGRRSAPRPHARRGGCAARRRGDECARARGAAGRDRPRDRCGRAARHVARDRRGVRRWIPRLRHRRRVLRGSRIRRRTADGSPWSTPTAPRTRRASC